MFMCKLLMIPTLRIKLINVKIKKCDKYIITNEFIELKNYILQ